MSIESLRDSVKASGMVDGREFPETWTDEMIEDQIMEADAEGDESAYAAFDGVK